MHINVQLDVDIGSSSVAKGVVNLVLGYLSNLVIELAFLIQVIPQILWISLLSDFWSDVFFSVVVVVNAIGFS